MKKTYTIETTTNSFHALEYNVETKQVDDIQVNLTYDNEEYNSSTYKMFDSKEEAIFAFKLLCSFVTYDNIEITLLEADIVPEEDMETIKNDKILQKFKLMNDETSNEDINNILNKMEF